jgi:hypothetical protein
MAMGSTARRYTKDWDEHLRVVSQGGIILVYHRAVIVQTKVSILPQAINRLRFAGA